MDGLWSADFRVPYLRMSLVLHLLLVSSTFLQRYLPAENVHQRISKLLNHPMKMSNDQIKKIEYSTLARFVVDPISFTFVFGRYRDTRHM